MTGTFGQPAIGPIIGRAQQLSQGFWLAHSSTSAIAEGVGETPMPFLRCFPNPVVEEGTIEVQLPEEEDVRLVLHDLLGRELAVLVDRNREGRNFTLPLYTKELSTGGYRLVLVSNNHRITIPIHVVR